MALTYFGDNAILNYLYNDNDTLGAYDSFLIQLLTEGGSAYAGGEQTIGLIRGTQTVGSEIWNVGDGFTTNFVVNLIDITFPPLSANDASSQRLTQFELYVDGIGQTPELFATGTLNNPITVQAGETPIIRKYDSQTCDGINIDIDETNKYTSAFRDKIYRYLFLAEDSLNSVVEYQFVVYNTSGNPTPLEFY